MGRTNRSSSIRGRRIQARNDPLPLPFDAADLVSINECQAILKRRLTDPLVELFTQLTGIELHVLWQKPLEWGLSANQGLLCPRARRCTTSGGDISLACRTCLGERWDPATLRERDRGRFTGPCHEVSYCKGIWWADVCLVLFLFQAPAIDERADVGRACQSGSERLPTAKAFELGESLLELLVHDLESTLRARIAEREVAAAHGRLREIDAAEAQDSEQAQRALLRAAEEPINLPRGGHARQVVQAMLDYVRAHYHRPMALKEVAASLGMNANYLSGLFHRATGTTFHRYLHAVRMSKAEELLREPRARICEVANAVGYASPNHFRSAFKAMEKVSPTAWTESQVSGGRES